MKLVLMLLSFALLVFIIMKLLPNIFALKGNAAYAKGQIYKTVKNYKIAVKLNGSNKIKCYYALMLMRAGSPKEAEQVLTGIVLDKNAKQQDKIMAKQYRCMALKQQGRLDDAIEDAEELFEKVKTTVLYGLLGYLKQLRGDDTLEFCKEAYEYNDSDRDICDNLVVAYYRNGDMEKAEEIAKKLREEYPEFTEAFYHSALVAHKTGKDALAREYLDKLDGCTRTRLTTVSKEEIEKLKEELADA
ncbi:MAG: tetratricopeptide repeat protein [Firmicutes bacterium]|nr:tetratricopeptide repeat protein [Bacillota bacterium]